jgi:hypothetical protein
MQKEYPWRKEIPPAKSYIAPVMPSARQRAAFFRRCGKRKR